MTKIEFSDKLFELARVALTVELTLQVVALALRFSARNDEKKDFAESED